MRGIPTSTRRGGRRRRSTLPLGAPFRPGLDPLPEYQEAWAVVKDRWGRPAHGDPRDALQRVLAACRPSGPTRPSATSSTRDSPTTRSSRPAACRSPSSICTTRTCMYRAAAPWCWWPPSARETARQGRLQVGELRVVYPGISDLLSPRAGDDPMHADFKIQGYETPDGTFAQFVRVQAPALLAHSDTAHPGRRRLVHARPGNGVQGALRRRRRPARASASSSRARPAGPGSTRWPAPCSAAPG